MHPRTRIPDTRIVSTVTLLLLLLPVYSSGQCRSGWVAGKTGIIAYQLWKPNNYDPQKKYPLVTVFHGAGLIGRNNEACNEYECQVLLEDSNQTKRPCFILAPQCPTFEDRWVTIHFTADSLYSIDKVPMSGSLKDVMTTIQTLIGQFSIDTTRLYMLGSSMGGYAQWDLLTRFPGKFASAFPLSGGVDTSKAMLMRHTPVWITHGGNDDIVPPGGSRKMYAALQKAGGNPIYKEFPNGGHLWNFIEAGGRAAIPWLFDQRLRHDMTPPPRPENVSMSYATGTGVSMTWTAATDVESGILSYRVFRDNQWLKTVYAPTCVDATARQNTTHAYVITTVNGAGLESNPGTAVSMNTATGAVAVRVGAQKRSFDGVRPRVTVLSAAGTGGRLNPSVLVSGSGPARYTSVGRSLPRTTLGLWGRERVQSDVRQKRWRNHNEPVRFLQEEQ